MGQIFDRIKRITRSLGADQRTPSTWDESLLSSDDDELRRIIDELSGDESTNSQPPPTPQPHGNIPAEVLKAHTILNVAVGSTTDLLKKAYRTAIAKWHPDRFSQASAADHAVAQQRAREINAAYITLKNHYRFS
ncbi:MAG: J domain-containing protein [Candidatus Kapabacteria bacterium]|nr:J domain-containing protein [Candidatus Kapabacteria bacterium]